MRLLEFGEVGEILPILELSLLLQNGTLRPREA